MARYEQHCGGCNRTGASSNNRAEVEQHTRTHNGMQHRGRPVSQVRTRGQR